MSVKRVQPGEVDLVLAVLRRFKSYVEPDPVDFLSDPRTVLFAAMEADEPVGWCYGYELVRPEGRCDMLLYELEVAEEARGRGHGKALIEALLAEAEARGHIEMWVLTDTDNQSAEALYRAMGADRTGQIMFTWELDH